MTTSQIITEVVDDFEITTPGKRVKSAIEFIVETAREGEVVHVTDEDYYAPALWNNYLDANFSG
jgi:hypothetical protein